MNNPMNSKVNHEIPGKSHEIPDQSQIKPMKSPWNPTKPAIFLISQQRGSSCTKWRGSHQFRKLSQSGAGPAS